MRNRGTKQRRLPRLSKEGAIAWMKPQSTIGQRGRVMNDPFNYS